MTLFGFSFLGNVVQYACRTLVSQLGKSMPPALGAQSLNHWATREALHDFKIRLFSLVNGDQGKREAERR